MRNPMHMTIQDYFKSGTDARIRSKLSSKQKTEVSIENSPFLKALKAAESLPPEKKQGLTIQDYMNRRAHTPSMANSPKIHSALTPSPSAGSFSGKPDIQAVKALSAEPVGAPEKSKADELSHEIVPEDHQYSIMGSIQRAAAKYGLPPALIQAVIKAESDYRVQAVSPAGAQGLMQLMPATAKELGVSDPFDIDQNILGGAQYLRKMLDQFNGDIEVALSAYNAGPGTVARYNGNVPYPETRSYVQRVMSYAEGFMLPGA